MYSILFRCHTLQCGKKEKRFLTFFSENQGSPFKHATRFSTRRCVIRNLLEMNVRLTRLIASIHLNTHMVAWAYQLVTTINFGQLDKKTFFEAWR